MRVWAGARAGWALGFAVTLAAAAQADTVTLVGGHFDVRYDTVQLGLLGAPVLDGDSLRLAPLQFKAESLDGLGEVTVDQSFTFTVLPHAGQLVTAFAFDEQGSYRLSGRQSDVAVAGELRASGPGVGGVGGVEGSAAIAPNGFFSPGTGVPAGWSAGARLDLAAASAGPVEFTLQNVLQAYTRPSDVGLRIASIETSGSLVLTVSAVPEPAAATLWLGAGAACALRLRRKRAAR